MLQSRAFAGNSKASCKTLRIITFAGRAFAWQSCCICEGTSGPPFLVWKGLWFARHFQGCFLEDAEWRARFQVVFVNATGRPEQGQDAGGLFKEFWEKCMPQRAHEM